jgi:hypothetical protein
MSKLSKDNQLRYMELHLLDVRTGCETVATRGAWALTTLAYAEPYVYSNYKYSGERYLSQALDYVRARAAECHL